VSLKDVGHYLTKGLTVKENKWIAYIHQKALWLQGVKMSDNRIVLRLSEHVVFECEFLKQYKNVPRARRQEWIRSILHAGLPFGNKFIELGQKPVQEVLLATTLAAKAEINTQPLDIPSKLKANDQTEKSNKKATK